MLDVFTGVVFAGACVFTFAWVVLAQRRTIKRLSDAYLRLTHFQRVVVALAVIVCTVYAQKPSTNDVNGVSGTNQVEIVEGGETNEVGEAVSSPLLLGFVRPLTSGQESASPFSAPYRLESISTNEGYSYAKPADGAIRGTWQLTGAYEDVQKVTLDAFAFPFGSDLCTSLWAYTWGKVRPQLKNVSNEIAAVGAPMSAIPDVSRFWTAATSNDTYLLTWENFAAGRQSLTTNNQQLTTLSAQIELRRNGDFITRSNDVECVYRRVIEPNPIVDPINPPDPNDPTKPLYPYGPVQDLSVIEETNAYCWVDIVVNSADAWVRFEGDGASNLADPRFAAKAGETNHVVILIGKTYKVTCDMPFTVVGKSDPAIDEWWENGNTLWLNWPVSIWSWGDDEDMPLLLMGTGTGMGGGNGFTMHVRPSGLGGEFSWTNSCCVVSGSGLHFSYGCDGFCLCGGCSARGCYGCEGYRIGCSGGSCGCSWYDDDDRHGEDDPDDPEPTPSISVSFDDAAVIFEDEYANMPGEVVPYRSTTTKLHLEAHGGMKGGTATFTFTNQEKLIGPDIPESISVPAGHCKKYEFTYRGQLSSGSTNDIVVTGIFTENDPEGAGDAATYTDEASMTSVKVELEAVDEAHDNSSANRHIFGVHEWVNYRHYPSEADVDFEILGAEQELIVSSSRFFCPWSGGTYFLRFQFGGVEFETDVDVYEPEVVCREVWWNQIGVVGQSGLIDMRLALYIEPTYVSFKDLYMEEIPDDEICPHDGYFSSGGMAKTGALSHSTAARAGVWSSVRYDTSWMADRACRETPYPQPWSAGTKEWRIPVGWGDYNGNIKGRITPNPTTQLFTINSSGTATIRKYNHEIRRAINNDVWLDDVLQDN